MGHSQHNDDVKISFLDNISEELEQRMTDGFQAYEASYGIDVNYKRFSIVLHNQDGIACGVINAYTAFAEMV